MTDNAGIIQELCLDIGGNLPQEIGNPDSVYSCEFSHSLAGWRSQERHGASNASLKHEAHLEGLVTTDHLPDRQRAAGRYLPLNSESHLSRQQSMRCLVVAEQYCVDCTETLREYLKGELIYASDQLGIQYLSTLQDFTV